MAFSGFSSLWRLNGILEFCNEKPKTNTSGFTLNLGEGSEFIFALELVESVESGKFILCQQRFTPSKQNLMHPN